MTNNYRSVLAKFAALNPELPVSWIPATGWIVTFAETISATALLLGFRTRMFALLSGLLLLAFAFGMTVGTGIKSALNASVFSASAGGLFASNCARLFIELGCIRKRVLMKKLFNLLLGMVLMSGTAAHAFAQDISNDERKARATDKAQNERTNISMSNREKNINVMLTLFNAVEQHDEQQQLELYQPNVEFHWPPSLYGGSRPGFDETWLALQPTARERRMTPRVVAASEDEVVVLYHQRGISPTGERFDGEVLGLYQLRGGKLARAQMFYFDTVAVASFLARAITPSLQRRVQKVLSQLKSLPNERRRSVERGFGKLQMMPPRQRPQLTDSDAFKRDFSEDERDLIKRMLNLNASYDGGAQSAPD